VLLTDSQMNVSASAKAAIYRLRMASVRPRDLTGFIELTYSIRYYCLPDLKMISVSVCVLWVCVCVHVVYVFTCKCVCRNQFLLW